MPMEGIDGAANRVASALVDLGVKPGDRVAVHIENRPEFVEVYQGVMRTGAIMVPTNVMYTGEEMQHILRDSGAKVLLVRGDLVSKIDGVRAELPALEHIVAVGPAGAARVIDYEAMKSDARPERPAVTVDKQDVAFIQYTSGTTGKPKGAMVSHANVLAVIDNMMDVTRAPEAIDEDIMLLVLPLFHARMR